MRTLHIITDPDRRGAQQHACDLARGLRASGVGASVAALGPGVQENPLDVEVLARRRRSADALRALRRLAKDFDVVVAHGSTTLTACALSIPRSCPFIYRQISDPMYWAATRSRRLRTGVFLRRCRSVVALSQPVAAVFAHYYRLPMRQMVVIPNAVSGSEWPPVTPTSRKTARAHLGLEESAFVAVYLGALVEEKGVDLAIRAIAAIDDGELLVVGDGPERAQLQLLAESLASSRVHMLGALSRPQVPINAADVVLLPSRGGDSMPAVLIEAGLSGLPVVTTSVGAISDVVLHGKTGMITPVGDDEAFVTAFKQLAEDAGRREELGRSAVEHCKAEFTIDAVVPQWVRLFETIVR